MTSNVNAPWSRWDELKYRIGNINRGEATVAALAATSLGLLATAVYLAYPDEEPTLDLNSPAIEAIVEEYPQADHFYLVGTSDPEVSALTFTVRGVNGKPSQQVACVSLVTSEGNGSEFVPERVLSQPIAICHP